MSRFRRAIHGVASSYALLAATAVYTLASVPVALHYLDKERFGLWALMGTLAVYLNLIDAGISSAAARLLIDHKDDRAGGNYGSLIKTGWLVSLIQAIIIFLTGLLFARTFAQLLAIPESLRAEFIQLVNWQCAVLAVSFATRMLTLILEAHQRMDWSNYIGVAGLMVNFAVQWLLFHAGFGVLSLAGGSMVAVVLSVSALGLVCGKLKLLPPMGSWGTVSWLRFRELFNYGKNAFLVGVGTQLILTSQIIVITRFLGLEAAAVWSVGLRMFNLVSQIGWRFSDMSLPALAEMMARGETDRLRDRYRSLAIIKFSFTAWLAVSFAACNSLFVSIWTHGRIQWPIANNSLLALWMIVLAVVHCHNSFVALTKEFRSMPYVYFLEGIVFVGLSCLVARWGGLAAIIGCSILCSALFTGAYGVWRVSRYFQIASSEVALNWLRPMIRMLVVSLPAIMLAWWLLSPVSAIPRLGGIGVSVVCIGGLFFLRYGIPVYFQAEILQRVPIKVARPLKSVFLKA